MQYQVGDEVMLKTGLVTVYIVAGVASDGTLFLKDRYGLLKMHPSQVKSPDKGEEEVSDE